jgi:uncharacterized protein (DUF2236 family)
MQVVQRINSERVVVLGWSRAILLQVSHPLVAAGVIDHSAFRGGMVQAAARLHHTVNAMLALMFGDPGRRAAAVARIRAIHDTVHGSLESAVGPFAAGTRYSANDPALLLWVHATLLDSTADIYERVVAPLSDADRDGLCVDAAPLLHELGGDPAQTPVTWHALQAYLHAVYTSGVLHVGEDARALGHAVLAPRAAGVRVPFSSVQELLTVGLLPPDIRAAYGFPWTESHARRFARALRLLRTIRRGIPRPLAHWRMARTRPAR